MRRLAEVTGLILGVLGLIVICLLLARPKHESLVESETTHPVEIMISKATNIHNDLEGNHEETTTTAATAAIDPDDCIEKAEKESKYPYSIEEAAAYVLDAGINGDQREEVLGEMYEEVQNWIDDNHVPETVVYADDTVYTEDYYYEEPVTWGGDALDPSDGVTWYNGHMETYYNLPMEGVLEIMYSLGYSGDYWVRGDGCKMFGPYIMVAADFGWLPRGTVVETSLGTGMVCDTGGGGWNWLDIAVTW